MRRLLFAVITILAIASFTSCEKGCKEHASKYSYKYLMEEADYKVLYWVNIDDPSSEKYIGNAKGLVCGEARARQYARYLNQPWNNRAYILRLEKDGRVELHRLVEGPYPAD